MPRLKISGNPKPSDGQVDFYQRAIDVLKVHGGSHEEWGVGELLQNVLNGAMIGDQNATDELLASLHRIDSAISRYREEMRGIHS